MGWMPLAVLLALLSAVAPAAVAGGRHLRPPLDDIGNAIPREYYVGCRPSIGECQHSCPDRHGIARIEPQKCDPESVWEKFACYCTFSGET
jgi:hypothetical protein